jgi:hypothetical protein
MFVLLCHLYWKNAHLYQCITHALRSRHVSVNIEESRISYPPVEPLALVLWLNQVTRRFCVELPPTPRADSCREPLPCTDSGYDFVLLFLQPCDAHLIPSDHRVHRAEPTWLSTPGRPRKAQTFRACSSPAPTQTKSQSAPAILG